MTAPQLFQCIPVLHPSHSITCWCHLMPPPSPSDPHYTSGLQGRLHIGYKVPLVFKVFFLHFTWGLQGLFIIIIIRSSRLSSYSVFWVFISLVFKVFFLHFTWGLQGLFIIIIIRSSRLSSYSVFWVFISLVFKVFFSLGVLKVLTLHFSGS